MEQYENLSGKSDVVSFMCGPNFIVVVLKDAGDQNHFLYDSRKPGHSAVETMQDLARSGRGLGTYIKETHHLSYARKAGSLSDLGLNN